MEFSITNHISYFSGYLDAVGRMFTTDAILIAPMVRLMDKDSSIKDILSVDILEETEIEKIDLTFEKDISTFLNHNPKERVLFYLIDYIRWFSDFSETCKCKKYKLAGSKLPSEYLAYTITCNGSINVLIFIYKKIKG